MFKKDSKAEAKETRRKETLLKTNDLYVEMKEEEIFPILLEYVIPPGGKNFITLMELVEYLHGKSFFLAKD